MAESKINMDLANKYIQVRKTDELIQWTIKDKDNTGIYFTYFKATKILTVNAFVDGSWFGQNKTIAQF